MNHREDRIDWPTSTTAVVLKQRGHWAEGIAMILVRRQFRGDQKGGSISSAR
jgi:hypothetical protein